MFTALATLTALAVSHAFTPYHTNSTALASIKALSRRAPVFDSDNVASDDVWYKYAGKGNFYQCLMECSDRLAGKGLGDARTPPSAESVWQGDLINGEYSNAIHGDFRSDPSILNENKIEGAFVDMHLDPLPAPAGPNVCFSVEHNEEPDSVSDNVSDYMSEFETPISEQRYQVGGQQYTKTGGHYRFRMNRRGGAIFAQYFKKPAAAARDHWGRIPERHELPALNRASDVLWGYWVRDNPEPSALQYYIVNHIQNEETLPLLARIVQNAGLQQLPNWSNHITLHSGDEGFNAILGSPMGATIAHFLIQHKRSLGHKHVLQIRVFRDNRQPGSDPQPQILFWIGDVDPGQVNDDEDDREMLDAVGRRRHRDRF